MFSTDIHFKFKSTASYLSTFSESSQHSGLLFTAYATSITVLRLLIFKYVVVRSTGRTAFGKGIVICITRKINFQIEFSSVTQELNLTQTLLAHIDSFYPKFLVIE